jgi:hypothetical protein
LASLLTFSRPPHHSPALLQEVEVGGRGQKRRLEPVEDAEQVEIARTALPRISSLGSCVQTAIRAREASERKQLEAVQSALALTQSRHLEKCKNEVRVALGSVVHMLDKENESTVAALTNEQSKLPQRRKTTVSQFKELRERIANIETQRTAMAAARTVVEREIDAQLALASSESAALSKRRDERLSSTLAALDDEISRINKTAATRRKHKKQRLDGLVKQLPALLHEVMQR